MPRGLAHQACSSPDRRRAGRIRTGLHRSRACRARACAPSSCSRVLEPALPSARARPAAATSRAAWPRSGTPRCSSRSDAWSPYRKRAGRCTASRCRSRRRRARRAITVRSGGAAPNQSFASFAIHRRLHRDRRPCRRETVVLDLLLRQAHVAQPVVAHVRRAMAVQAVVHESVCAALQRGHVVRSIGAWSSLKPALGRNTSAGSSASSARFFWSRRVRLTLVTRLGHRLRFCPSATTTASGEKSEVQQRCRAATCMSANGLAAGYQSSRGQEDDTKAASANL